MHTIGDVPVHGPYLFFGAVACSEGVRRWACAKACAQPIVAATGPIARVDLPVLDDRGLQGFPAGGRRDLPEIAEARHGRKSILIASRVPVRRWPEVTGEPTIADAVLDRIVHNAYRVDLKGESQRKRNRPPPLGGSDK